MAHLIPTAAEQRIAIALATVDVTRSHFHLGCAQLAWADLKQARGQRVNFARLTPAHIIAPPASATDADQIAQTQTRAHNRAVAYIRSLGRRPASDAWGQGLPDHGGAA